MKSVNFSGYGIDEVVVLESTRSLPDRPQGVLQRLPGKRIGVSVLVAGYDHRVGSDPDQTQNEMFEIARPEGITPSG